MPRILFATNSATGHVLPALTLAKKLVARGHEVGWYTSPRFRNRIEASGATFMPYRTAQDIEWERIDELFPERRQLKESAQFRWDMTKSLGLALDQYKDLSDIVNEFRADVILGDVMLFAAQFVSEKMGLPYVFYSPVPLMTLSHDTPPPDTPFRPNASPWGRLRNRLLNWLVFRVALGGINREVAQCRARVGLPKSEHVFFDLCSRKADLHLQTTVRAFEFPRSDLPDHVHFIGALLPEAPSAFAAPSWWDEVKDERPVVLVTQGTIAKNLDDLVNPTIQGLAAEDVLVVGTIGDQPLDTVKPHPLPDNVRLEPFIPFAHLLPHVDVMVTNGGYGGTHYALTHGVPLVVAGQTEDKAEVGARISWSGVGINLKTSTPTPEQVRKAVNDVLSTGHYKRRAQSMQAEFANHDAPTEAAELIEAVVVQRSKFKVQGSFTPG